MTEKEIAERVYYLVEGEEPKDAMAALRCVLAAMVLAYGATNEQASSDFLRTITRMRVGAEVH